MTYRRTLSHAAVFFVYRYGDQRDLHALTPPFHTRRSSDLPSPIATAAPSVACAPVPMATASSPPAFAPEPIAIALAPVAVGRSPLPRSEEHTSELQSLMRISYAVFCLKKNRQ